MFFFSCNTVDVQNLNGTWVSVKDHSYEELRVRNDSIIFIDNFNMYYFGDVDDKNQQFKIEIFENHIENFNFEIKDSLLILSKNRIFEKMNWSPIIDQSGKMELIELETDVAFPFQEIGQKNKKSIQNRGGFRQKNINANIKIRARENLSPFQINNEPIELFDLFHVFPNGICSGGQPLNYQYDQVAIFIEKGASVSDLVILEQFLRLNNHVKTFILVTKSSGVGAYKVIVDKRISFLNDKYTIQQIINDYIQKRKKPVPSRSAMPPPPPLPEISHENSIEYYINSKSGELILIEDIQH